LGIALSNWKDQVLSMLSQGKGFEITCEGGSVKVSEVKGVSKGSVSLKQVKGIRKGRVRPPSAKLRELIVELASRLVASGKSFKVTLGQGDFTLRFDLDHYVRVDSKSSSVVGFKSLDEDPISLIVDILESHGEVRLLKPLT